MKKCNSIKSGDAACGREVIVGLLWHSVASGNLGVVALTLSQLAIVQAAAREAGVSARVKIFGWRLDGALETPTGFENIEYIEIDATAFLNPFSAFRKEIGSCDLVLDVGEGDSFSDIYGIKRLLYLCISKRVASRGRASLILSPQTLGPFTSPVAEKLARWAVRRANRVFARDPLSKEWADTHLPLSMSDEAIDMAFHLPYEPQQKSRDSVRIGINVSGLLYSGGYGGRNSLGLSVNFADLSHQLIEWALGVENSEVWLVPHVYSLDISEEDDMTAARTLMERYPGVKCAGPFPGPIEAKSFMSGLDFFTGGRMHACIGAFSAGVPIAPLAYSRKFNGLFAALNYPALVDCKVCSTDEAHIAVIDAFSRRGALERSVATGVAIARGKLRAYEEALVRSLKEVVE